MIVFDSSALVELIARTALADPVAEVINGHPLVAPDSLDVEVLHALRGMERGRKITQERAAQAVLRFGTLPLERVPVSGLHAEVWALRHAVSVYDAAYLAVAQRFGCGLLTLDRRLAAGAPRGVPITVL